MPVLANARYERFAQGVAKGLSQHEAYKKAGYSPDRPPKAMRSEASKLARRPQIAARIAELQEKHAAKLGITVDHLIRELNDMLMLAKRVKHPAAGVGAILAKGKLLGLIVDRAEIEGTIRKPSRRPTVDKTQSLEDWKEKFAPKDQLQ